MRTAFAVSMVLAIALACNDAVGPVPSHGVFVTISDSAKTSIGEGFRVSIDNRGLTSAFLRRCQMIFAQRFVDGTWQFLLYPTVLCSNGPTAVEISPGNSLHTSWTFQDTGRFWLAVYVASDSVLSDETLATSNAVDVR